MSLQNLRTFRVFPKRYGFFPYLFLIYLVLPILNIRQEDGWKQIIGYVLLGIFLLTYRQLYMTMHNRFYTFWLSLQMLIVLVMSIAYDPSYLYMGFFPANFIGWYQDDRKFRIALGLLVVVELVPVFYHGMLGSSGALYFLPFLIIMLLSPFGVRSMIRRAELEQELDQANARIKELVKSEERARIARDLHDTLGHTLSLITLKSQLVHRLIDKDPAKAQQETREIEQTSRAALNQVRELVSNMRAATIPEELRSAETILQTAGIQVKIDWYKEEKMTEEIPALIHNIVSMCLREAVTNVVKHSQASHCWIQVERTKEGLCCTIRDDGIGVQERQADQTRKSGGNGLKGMKERLALLEGQLTIEHGEGTLVVIEVPLIEKEQVNSK